MGGESPTPKAVSEAALGLGPSVPNAACFDSIPRVNTEAFVHQIAAGRHWRFASALARKWKKLLVIATLSVMIAGAVSYVGMHVWALYHFRAGKSFFERFHSYEALPHFESTLRVWPKDKETLILASRSSRQLGHTDDSARFLDTYRETYGNDDDLSLEQVLLRAQLGNVDSVEKFCSARLAQDDPASSLILEALARGYMRRFQWNKAEKCIKQWVEREPENPQAFLLKGFMENERDNFSEAITSYRRVLELDPEQDEARLHLGELLLDLTQAEEARPQLEYLRRKQPDNLKVAVALARCADQLGNQAEAEQILNDILDRYPSYPPALFLRGRLAMRADQAGAAESFLRRACLLQPGDLEAHYQLYQCLAKEGKTTESQELLSQIQQIESDLKRIHEITTIQLEQSPHDPELMCEVGVILLRAGQEDQGVLWLERALVESNDKHTPAHRALADYYKKKGNKRLAAQHLDKVGSEVTQ
jgi:tetratricopeptide (TPR) repeat protein